MTTDWLKEVAKQALCSIETLEATYDIARALLNRCIAGDLVEAGVYAGAHCAVMAKAILDHQAYIRAAERPDVSSHSSDSWNKRVHLFDSFTGIPQCGPNDIEFTESNKQPGESACSRQKVEANMKAWGIPSELLVYYEGLFEETIPDVCLSPGMEMYQRLDHKHPIALLRLDGDLYESTKVCVEYLLPLVSRGGWVICDDYNLSGCRQAINEKIIPAPIYWRVPTK